MMAPLSDSAIGGLITVACYVLAWAVLRLTDRLHTRRAAAAARQIAEWRAVTHLDDCRRGVHRTTLDADWQTVHQHPYLAAPQILERCIDCGLTTPFATVHGATNHAKRPHG